MKRIMMIGLLVVLFLPGLNGCCVQHRPKKIVFTPELDLAIQDKIAAQGFESPTILLIGDNGQTIAMDAKGETFTPCRAPIPEEIEGADVNQAKMSRRQSYENKKERETLSELPICEGMKDIKGIFPVKNITIMTVKKNPRYKLVSLPDGGLEERCTPNPGEDESVCP